MSKKRVREAGYTLPGKTGEYNAITDVAGVEVGYKTITFGEPSDYKGAGSPFARTGVTMILPQGKKRSALFVGRHNLNGNGELTGTHWMDDSGYLHGPIGITNTNSVGIVRDTMAKWMIDNNYYYPYIHEGKPIEGVGYFYPVVGETWDGLMNDTNGFHVTASDVYEAIDDAKTGPIAEGNVGGGNGMQCHEFKGGTGTSSRVLTDAEGGYTLGVLVQANHGTRACFEMFGVPIGRLLKGGEARLETFSPKPGTGSIIVVIATDAPVSPLQLQKICKRIPIAIGRLGAGFENDSGDIFLAFSTANNTAYQDNKATLISDDALDPIYKATAEAVEEAILNAMFAAESMTGKANNHFYALPQDDVYNILKEYRSDILKTF
ncbi:P1 family peptidase [Brochothrix thermosphacta]|uniref:DmpA family aminopeptidase n=1 Tax=Brochothrix thermosphacta TaxID=2756 RepID=UPI000AD74E10|nr:P1 family peptidase [Brochothrix thermosphacta]